MSQVNQATATENTADQVTGATEQAAAPKAKRVKKEPVAKPEKAPSKASISRQIMKSFFDAGKTYEEAIAEMMRVNGYDRQLARGTYKNNAVRAGVPVPAVGVRGAKKKATVTVDTAPVETTAPAAAEQTAEAAPL